MEHKIVTHMMCNVILDERINLNDKERLIQEFERVGIKDFSFWEACISEKTVVNSIAQSHKNIVFWAKEQGMKEVAILEQDVAFPNPKGWEYFLKNKPEQYDIYSSCNYLIDNRVVYEPPLIKVNDFTGFHCYFINETWYDKFLSTPSGQHIDTAQKGGDFYCCFPYPAIQNPSKSANNQFQMVDYTQGVFVDQVDKFVYK